MSIQKEIITKIRDEYSPERNTETSLRNQYQACSRLAEDLYGEEEHFLFELIQNADDNNYAEGVIPSLDISVKDIEIADEIKTCLILRNNEIGFSEDNVKSLCRIGQSTKKKIAGFIGEKGIGFKSVFAVTEKPYIFSNGFQFSLPKTIMLGNVKLGYIVPVWEDIPPIEINTNTTIVIPLNNPDGVVRKIQEIAPQTLLFLHKLSSISIHVDWRGIRSNCLIKRQSVSARTIRLESVVEIDGQQEYSSVEYFCNTTSIDVPENLIEDKRKGIKSRELTIALPLTNDENYRGGVFAYLPIQDGTVLPFLLNCDFLLTSSREKILENGWNRWIRDQIAPFFADIIEQSIADNDLDIEFKQFIFSRIPTTTGTSFLEPIAQQIHEILKHRKCLLTEGTYQPIDPDHCYCAPEKVRNILKSLEWVAAEDADGDFMLAESFEQCDEILKKLNMRTCNCKQVVALVSDDLIAGLSDEQLCLYYLFLIENAKDDVTDTEHSLLPTNDNGLRTMLKSTPDRFICFPKETDICIRDFPQLKVSFLDDEFYAYLTQCDESESLLEFIQKSLGVRDYKLGDYCRKLRDLLNGFEGNECDFLEISKYIIANGVYPDILLTNKGFVSRKEKTVVVSPEYNPQSGWQYIWSHGSDQQHFAFCKNYTREEELKMVENGVVLLYPSFNITEYNSSDSGFSYEGWAFLNKLNYSPSRPDRTVWFPTLPATFEKDFSETAIAALIGMFSSITDPISDEDKLRCGLLVKAKYYPKGQRWPVTTSFPSNFLKTLKNCCWMSTTKGYQQPSMTWYPNEDIKNIWQDNVPYITDNIPRVLLEEFGVKTSITNMDISNYLLNCSETQQVVEVEFAYKLYLNLSIRNLEEQILLTLKSKKCIYIPESKKWVFPSQCLWEKSSVFENDFFYLSTIYPESLKEFFVEKIGVQEKVDSETYLKLWEDCEGSVKAFNKREVEDIYKNLMKFKNRPFSNEKWWRWHNFCKQTKKLLSHDGIFKAQTTFVFSDSHFLEELFRDNINVAYIPAAESNDEWKKFYSDFGIPTLTDSVGIEILEDDFACGECRDCTEDYLTTECIVMVATWILQNSSYSTYLAEIEKLKDVQILDVGHDIPVQYTLDLHGKIYEKDTVSAVFWDESKNIIYCNTNGSDDFCMELASHISQKLVSINAACKLSDAIENYFGQTSLHRIERLNWNIPEEFKSWYEMGGRLLQDNFSDVELEIASPEMSAETECATNNIENEKSIEISVEKPDYATEIANSFNRAGKSQEENLKEDYIDEDDTPSEVALARRMSKQREKIAAIQHNKVFVQRDSSRASAAQQDDIVTSLRLPRSGEKKVRKLLESLDPDMKVRIFHPVDPQVRTFLEQEYSGKCQVCGKTFPMVNGRPHFMALHLIPRSSGGVSHNGNAICLCAEHFAQWQSATKYLPDLLRAVKEASLDDHPQINFELAGQQVTLTYTKRHFIDFKAILGKDSE